MQSINELNNPYTSLFFGNDYFVIQNEIISIHLKVSYDILSILSPHLRLVIQLQNQENESIENHNRREVNLIEENPIQAAEFLISLHNIGCSPLQNNVISNRHVNGWCGYHFILSIKWQMENLYSKYAVECKHLLDSIIKKSITKKETVFHCRFCSQELSSSLVHRCPYCSHLINSRYMVPNYIPKRVLKYEIVDNEEIILFWEILE
eukprot:gene16269-22160_t